jgi:hypothetical protein
MSSVSQITSFISMPGSQFEQYVSERRKRALVREKRRSRGTGFLLGCFTGWATLDSNQ